MGVSRTGKDFRELKEKYFQALNALKQYIYSDSKQIFFEDELKGQETAFSDEVCGRIINAVRAGNEDGVREQIEKFLQEYQQKRCRILPMKRQFLLLQRAIDALTEELGMDQKRNRSLGNFIRNIEEIRDFSQIREAWITNLIEITKEAGAIAERKMNSYYINQILDYVQKNYRRDLSLEEVAEYVNLSSGYLSNYFKEKVGMNFVDYLTKLRIEKAKELLMHTNEKIYKIAEDVGYQNSQYFVTILKRKQESHRQNIENVCQDKKRKQGCRALFLFKFGFYFDTFATKYKAGPYPKAVVRFKIQMKKIRFSSLAGDKDNRECISIKVKILRMSVE